MHRNINQHCWRQLSQLGKPKGTNIYLHCRFFWFTGCRNSDSSDSILRGSSLSCADGRTTGSVYSAAQFITTPALGILSDRYGRRPVYSSVLLVQG